jgi:preprotein translocase subunit SecF
MMTYIIPSDQVVGLSIIAYSVKDPIVFSNRAMMQQSQQKAFLCQPSTLVHAQMNTTSSKHMNMFLTFQRITTASFLFSRTNPSDLSIFASSQ